MVNDPVYDFYPDENGKFEIPDDFNDPTRDPGFDIVDAIRIRRQIRTEKYRDKQKSSEDAQQRDLSEEKVSDVQEAEENSVTGQESETVRILTEILKESVKK